MLLMPSILKLLWNLVPRNAYGFAFALNLVVCACALFLKPVGVGDVALIWVDAFWLFAGFTLHIVMTFVCGYALISSPVFNRWLHMWVSLLPDVALYAGVFIITALLSWLNWGVGLVSSAMLCRIVIQQKRTVFYPALVMVAYSGFIVWHGGVTGSAPLLVSAQKVLIEGVAGPLPLTSTIFAPWNIALTAFVVITMVCAILILQYWLKRRGAQEPIVTLQETAHVAVHAKANERVLTYAFCLMGGVFCIVSFWRGHACDLGMVNIIFFLLALAFHQGWSRLLPILQKCLDSAVPIIVQFPLYAAIAGVLNHTGLGQDLVNLLMVGSTDRTLSLWTFLSAGFVNLLIPSGGGQWLVQGPIVLTAAAKLHVPYPHVVMALAWGDAWTNLIQPFWMLPVMQLCHLRLRHVLPYAIYLLCVSGVAMALFFLFFMT